MWGKKGAIEARALKYTVSEALSAASGLSLLVRLRSFLFPGPLFICLPFPFSPTLFFGTGVEDSRAILGCPVYRQDKFAPPLSFSDAWEERRLSIDPRREAEKEVGHREKEKKEVGARKKTKGEDAGETKRRSSRKELHKKAARSSYHAGHDRALRAYVREGREEK